MTTGEITFAMLKEDFLLWRCLHGGPLDQRTIEQWPPDSTMPWQALRARNVPLLKKLTQVYGACAVVALDHEQVVGQLRFYPREVCALAGAGAEFMCLQQRAPNGPPDDFVEAVFPPLSQLKDKTLFVHCLMTIAPQSPEHTYRRKGIGSQMVRVLIDWASESGWQAIETVAYEDLDLLYGITGVAGRTFWERLGFRVIETGVEQAFVGEGEEGFMSVLREQARSVGLATEAISHKYTMRLGLT
jgi:hypothetical protein